MTMKGAVGCRVNQEMIMDDESLWSLKFFALILGAIVLCVVILWEGAYSWLSLKQARGGLAKEGGRESASCAGYGLGWTM